MKRNLLQLLMSLFLVIPFVGCNDSDEPSFYFNDESSKIISDGICFKAKGGEVTLTLEHKEYADISVEVNDSEEEDKWLNVDCRSLSEVETVVAIKAKENSLHQERTGGIILRVNGDRMMVDVKQLPLQQIYIENRHIVTSCDGEEVVVSCQTDGDIDVSLFLHPDWLRISEIKETAEGRDIIFTVDKNLSVGRIAKVYIEGKDGGFDWLAIQQKPCAFEEKVVLETKGEGRLDVLLGNDTENLRRIRSLTLIGPINGYDIYTLKKMFVSSAALMKPLDYPLTLDLSEARIHGNYNNIYEEEFHFTVQFPEDKVSFCDYEIPDEMFSYAENLVSIKLPLMTEIIGRHAFRNCTALTSVDIPEDVRRIEYGAFSGCSATEINIGRASQLQKLEGYAFSTSSVIASLRLPELLEDIDEAAFSGCSCKELTVYWLTPPELRVLPNPKNCILYVPEGSKDAYLASPNWSRFSQIVETSEYWED